MSGNIDTVIVDDVAASVASVVVGAANGAALAKATRQQVSNGRNNDKSKRSSPVATTEEGEASTPTMAVSTTLIKPQH